MKSTGLLASASVAIRARYARPTLTNVKVNPARTAAPARTQSTDIRVHVRMIISALIVSWYWAVYQIRVAMAEAVIIKELLIDAYAHQVLEAPTVRKWQSVSYSLARHIQSRTLRQASTHTLAQVEQQITQRVIIFARSHRPIYCNPSVLRLVVPSSGQVHVWRQYFARPTHLINSQCRKGLVLA
jgi:hypothetical protein